MLLRPTFLTTVSDLFFRNILFVWGTMDVPGSWYPPQQD